MKMGRENFVKRFSTETGESPKAFFNRIRAAAIARELGDPAIPTSEIAERFEFTDGFIFRVFSNAISASVPPPTGNSFSCRIPV